MICRLFELFDDTGIDVGAKENCGCECPDYVSDSLSDRCNICKNVEIELSKHKYSWMIVRKMQFNTNFLVDEETAYQIIKLIHPSLSNIWIIKWVTLDKEDETKQIIHYTTHLAGKEFKQDDLFFLNTFLTTRCDYDGRKIKLKDFETKG